MKHYTTISGLITFLLLNCYALQVSAQCEQLLWSDEFDQAVVNWDDWTPMQGDGCDVHWSNCGWGNSESQVYTNYPENLYLQNGALHIKVTHSDTNQWNNDYKFKSARIVTRNKQLFYPNSRIDIRFKLPKGRGLWPAFWMLQDDGHQPADRKWPSNWPSTGEVDFFEARGDWENWLQPNFINGADWPTYTFTHLPLPGTTDQVHQGYDGFYAEDFGSASFVDDFHIMSIYWYATSFEVYLDEQLAGIVTKDDLPTIDPELPNANSWPFSDAGYYLLLNVATGGGFSANTSTGAWNNDMTPKEIAASTPMVVDYIRYYELDENSGPAVISGPLEVGRGATKTYAVNKSVGDITWTVPAGASIVDGQGTANLVVEWGDISGVIGVEVSSDCGTTDALLSVSVIDPSLQSPVGGNPWAVPGHVEAENFDEGGEGVAYHDNSVGNITGYDDQIRTGNDVDIALGATGWFIIEFNDEEWLEYTIDVEFSGIYRLSFNYNTGLAGQSYQLLVDGSLIETIHLPNTEWENWTDHSQEVHLNAGIQILSIKMNGTHTKLDYFDFELVEKDLPIGVSPRELEHTRVIQPNPFANSFALKLHGDEERIRIYSAYGQLIQVLTPLEVSRSKVGQSWPIGTYVLEVTTRSGTVHRQRVFKQ